MRKLSSALATVSRSRSSLLLFECDNGHLPCYAKSILLESASLVASRVFC